MQTSRKLGLVALCLAGAVLAAAMLRHRADDRLVKEARYVWEEGLLYRYGLTYVMSGATSVMGILDPNVTQPEQPVDSVFEGVVEETLVNKDGMGSVLAVSLRPKSGPPTDFLLTVSELGAVRALTFDPSVPAQQRQQTRAMWALLEARLPGRNELTWVAREDDLNGTWTSRYTAAVEDHAALHMTKTPGGGTQGALGLVRRGALTVKFGLSAGRKEEVTGQVDTEYRLEGHGVGRETSQVRWRLLEVLPLDAARRTQGASRALELQRHGVHSDLRGVDEQVLERRRQLEERVAGASLGTVMEQLVTNSEGINRELLRPSRQLEAFLELDPVAAADAALEGILRVDSGSAAFSSIATALTANGSAAAQGALVAAMERLDEDAALRKLVPHVGMVAQPNAASEEFLRALARTSKDAGVIAAAELSLGVMANRLLVQQPSRADRIFADAREALERGGDPELSMKVLGNIGHPDQTLLASAALLHGTPAERQNALQSLRWVMTAAAKQILMDSAARDSDAHARASAMESLGYRPQDDATLHLYVDQLKRESAVPVLKEALRNLSTMLRGWPAARAAYAGFLEACAHPELCDYARGLWLASGA